MTPLNVAPIYADAWAKTTFLGLAIIVEETHDSAPTTLLAVTCRRYWLRFAFTETNIAAWVDVAAITSASNFPPTPPHGLLSDTHPDTTAAAPQPNDLLIASPGGTWSRLPDGSPGQVLARGASKPEWLSVSGDISLDSSGNTIVGNDTHSHTATTLPVPTSTTPGAAAFNPTDFSIASSIVSLATTIARKTIAQLITAAWAFDGTDPTTGAAIGVGTAGATQWPRLLVNPDGSLAWSPAAAGASDTALQRISAALMQLTGGLVITKGLTVDTNTLSIDPANHRVGILTASPEATLHIPAPGTFQMGSAADAYRSQLNPNGLNFDRPGNNSYVTQSALTGKLVFRTSNASPGDKMALSLDNTGSAAVLGGLTVGSSTNAAAAGDLVTASGFHIGKHKSSDGTAGYTGTLYATNSTATAIVTWDVKDGLLSNPR